ncbi:hypothetical protein LXA43DRAFT_348952 [Ganoderma leucocontextum]|nr:hypothetical protein LXA43DRAFT_348952 [Ganoderma leucocontextum]
MSARGPSLSSRDRGLGSRSQPPPGSRPRAPHKRIKMLEEMPLDVLYEIFSHLHPCNLLVLDRTSEGLRTVLTQRNCGHGCGKAAGNYRILWLVRVPVRYCPSCKETKRAPLTPLRTLVAAGHGGASALDALAGSGTMVFSSTTRSGRLFELARDTIRLPAPARFSA